MGQNSKIEWCDHTFNPWYGCTKVSAVCANCYAETMMGKRFKKLTWGKGKKEIGRIWDTEHTTVIQAIKKVESDKDRLAAVQYQEAKLVILRMGF